MDNRRRRAVGRPRRALPWLWKRNAGKQPSAPCSQLVARPAPSNSSRRHGAGADSARPQRAGARHASGRAALAEKGLRAAEVQPTGPSGRLLKEDVLQQADRTPVAPAATVSPAPAAAAAPRPAAPLAERAAVTLPASSSRFAREEESVRDEPDPPPHRPAAGRGPADGGAAHHVQRNRHDGSDGPAAEAQRRVSAALRREAGLHVVLRQSDDRCPEADSASECRDPRAAHRLSQLLRHRHRGRRRQGAGRARAAQRRVHELRRDRAGDRRFRPAAPRTTSSSSKSCKGARSRSPTAASTARCCPRRSSTRRKAASSACTRFKTAPSPATARW